MNLKGNNKYILIAVGIVAVVIGGYFLMNQSSGTEEMSTDGEQVTTQMPAEGAEGVDEMIVNEGEEMDEEAMELHRQEMNDGRTIMAMSGHIDPVVLYATPGQELRIANHESYDLRLIAEDGTFETELVPAGEDGSFIAPETPGKYVFYNSEDETIKGTLIVEE